MTGPPPGIRFAPPAVTVASELAWLLSAAFGPLLPQPPEADPDEIARLASLFDLGPRIVARHGSDRIRRRIGTAAEPLVLAHRRAVALTLAADVLAQRLVDLAQDLRQPLLFLKGYALHRLIPDLAGGRPFIDLDVLAPAGTATQMHGILVADGWISAAAAENPQHLPPLTAPQGIPVDIHFRLRGVTVAGQGWATAEELVAAGLCQPLDDSAAHAWLPGPPLLAAHLAAHAIEQHGQRPATYPLLRAAADLSDLSAHTAPGSLEASAAPLVRASLAEAELRALFSLVRILASGRLPSSDRDEEGGADLLLRHIVAGALDRDYRRSLSIDHTAGRLREARDEGRLVRYIAGKLVVPEGRLETKRPVFSWRGFGQRIIHLLRLGGRLAAATVSRLRRALNR